VKIAIIDLETTGFLDKGGFIVEVGIASLDTDTGDVSPAFDSVCREEGMTAKDREAWIFTNSTLTVEAVRNAPLFPTIKDEIDRIIHAHDGATAFNKAFDFNFLRWRDLTVRNEIECPMLLATNVCRLPGFYGKYKWPKVEEAWKHFFPNEPYTEAHRGLDDAMHEARIVHALWKMGLFARSKA